MSSSSRSIREGLLATTEKAESASDGLGCRSGRDPPRPGRTAGCALVRGGGGPALGPRLPGVRDRIRGRLLARLRLPPTPPRRPSPPGHPPPPPPAPSPLHCP